MGEENISQEFRMKTIEKIKKYFVKEIEQNELRSKKHDKVYTTLNCFAQFLILASGITECVSVSAFASLVGTHIGITSSIIICNNSSIICTITAAIKNFRNNCSNWNV